MSPKYDQIIVNYELQIKNTDRLKCHRKLRHHMIKILERSVKNINGCYIKNSFIQSTEFQRDYPSN